VVMKMLEKEPETRYNDVKTIQNDIALTKSPFAA